MGLLVRSGLHRCRNDVVLSSTVKCTASINAHVTDTNDTLSHARPSTSSSAVCRKSLLHAGYEHGSTCQQRHSAYQRTRVSSTEHLALQTAMHADKRSFELFLFSALGNLLLHTAQTPNPMRQPPVCNHITLVCELTNQ
jgi:hypothetical protein